MKNYKDMLVRQNRIDCIIVKDFSRFGRNYIDVCDYLEQVFPLYGVRFISVNDKQDDNLTILLDRQPACHVSAKSQMYVAPGDLRTSEADELYHKTAPVAEMVREYMTAIEKAPLLKARDLDKDFRLLAEFNGIVLAGLETEKGYRTQIRNLAARLRQHWRGPGTLLH